MPVPARPYCVYCGATDDLTLSCMVPDGTLYPGVQRMCADAAACCRRIRDNYHQDGAWPECGHCRQPVPAAAGPSHA